MRKPMKAISAASALALLGGVALPGIARRLHSTDGSATATDRRRRHARYARPTSARHQDRFPDKAQLRAQLLDPQRFNPASARPPFGKHNTLNDEQIHNIVDFIYTL